MKRYIISLLLVFAAWQSAFAMSYERAREEALYLTDKMAYELNLNDQQYNDAYEINLDYFLSLNSEADLYEDYLSYRLSDFRHILYDWQYSLMLAADYFIRPVYWRAGGWYFPIYRHYTIGHFYYSYPSVYYNYRGGHGRIHYHSGFYASRRPVWNGGLRGNQPVGGRPNRGSAIADRGGRINGNGYHIDMNNRDRGGRGNSFGNSSSRNPRNDYSRREDSNRDYRSQETNRYSDSSNKTYDRSRNAGSREGYSSPRSSSSRSESFGGSHSSGSRGGGFGGSRGAGGGGVSRGGRR